MKQGINIIRKDITSLKKDIQKTSCNTQDIKMKDSVHNILQKVEIENTAFSAKLEAMENYSRRENIVIEGLRESPNEDPQKAVDFIFNALEMPKPAIQRCHRLGRRQAGRPRPFIIRLTNYSDKITMYMNAKNLRKNANRIFLKDDVCQETQKKPSRTPLGVKASP